jgi:zinc protease
VTGTFMPEDAPQRAEIRRRPACRDAEGLQAARKSTLTSEDFEPSQDNIMKRAR